MPIAHTHVRTLAAVLVLSCATRALAASPAVDQRASAPVPQPSLSQLSLSIESLVTRVSPSVVQVLVTGYGPIQSGNERDADMVLGRQRSMGSGVIIDAAGLIVTNAHVVAGAQRVQVIVPAPAPTGGTSPLRSLVSARGQTVDARVVGTSEEVDLALLKVDLTDLPALPLANYDALRQGQMVFAFGSPEGLRNSVTMGVVSAVARQPDVDHPMVYIQTDAPINHGNSGGPLVNVNGEVVGINTFILSESGGSQGLGFAIPSAVVAAATPQLREFGHLHRGGIGVNLQAITPEMAHGLGLARDAGLVIADILPGGPADTAGLHIQDVIESIDGVPMDSLLALAFHFYTRHNGDAVSVNILRGAEHLTVRVGVIERSHDQDQLGHLVDPEQDSVPALGIVGLSIDERVARMVPEMRLPSGVIVASRAWDAHAADVSLSTGDIIHRLNSTPIADLADLRRSLAALSPRAPVVLQIERTGQLMFVTYEAN